MKKTLATILALALVFSAVPAFAAENPTGSETEINFRLDSVVNDPTYMITIPSAITLEEGGNDVPVVASDVADLGGKKISVTVAGTQDWRNQFVLEGTAPNGQSKVMGYTLTTASGDLLATTGSADQFVGTELVSFDDNGSDAFRIAPQITEYTSLDTDFTGTLYFGFELVEA